MIYRLIYCSNNFIILAASAATKATANTHHENPIHNRATAKPIHQLRHTGQLTKVCTHSHLVLMVLNVSFLSQVNIYSPLIINAADTATKIQTENKNTCIILILFLIFIPLLTIHFFYLPVAFVGDVFLYG